MNEPKVACNKCKHKGFGPQFSYECRHVNSIYARSYDPISGKYWVKYHSCLKQNRKGDCQYFELKKSWWRRWLGKSDK